MQRQHYKNLAILLFASAIIFLSFGLVFAQASETFDIATFQPPKGWQKQDKGGVVVFNISDAQKGSYAMIMLFASGTSSGNAKGDFEADWQEFIAGQMAVKGKPEIEPAVKSDGWDVVTGGTSFENEMGAAAVLMSTYSGFGKTFSAAAIFNSQDNVPDIEAFAASLKLKRPEANKQVKNNPPVSNTIKAVSTGFAFTTSNFDDGWNAVDTAEWVQVNKGDTRVLLHYGIQYTDETRNFDDNKRIEHYWNLLISPRYKVSNINVAKTDYGKYDRVYFGEADGVEISTGKKAHIALMITSENGFANCIEVVTPDQATLTKQFPNYDKIKEMNNYNKFAVSAKDLPGTWENSSAAYSQYYNTNTGNYAGMGGVSINAKFIFRSNSTFHFDYIGVSGMMGTPEVHTEKRDGKFTVNNWDMTITDKKGTPVAHFAQFEAIRGGRVLHIQNKQYSGLKYRLYKQK